MLAHWKTCLQLRFLKNQLTKLNTSWINVTTVLAHIASRDLSAALVLNTLCDTLNYAYSQATQHQVNCLKHLISDPRLLWEFELQCCCYTCMILGMSSHRHKCLILTSSQGQFSGRSRKCALARGNIQLWGFKVIQNSSSSASRMSSRCEFSDLSSQIPAPAAISACWCLAVPAIMVSNALDCKLK